MYTRQGFFRKEMLKTQVPKSFPGTQFRKVSPPTFAIFAKFLGYFRPGYMLNKKMPKKMLQPVAR